MGKKRKSDTARLDEVDRSTYSSFCNAANSLSQLYTHAMHLQKLSFHAGERHSLEKLCNWILKEQEKGGRLTICSIFAYIQNELDYGSNDLPLSPRIAHQQHNMMQQFPQSGLLMYSNVLNNEVAPRTGKIEGNQPTSNDTSMEMHGDSP